MTPLERYQLDIATGTMTPDPAQEQAIAHFQRVYEELLRKPMPARGVGSTALQFLRRGLLRRQESDSGRTAETGVKGLYIYGGVGRGKTYLMDVFFESLPFENKMRTHFHRFMQRVHAELNLLKRQKNPLETVARTIANEARVICFDEFFVSDIGDAMILGGLLTHLLDEGVTLVATSNIQPDCLYENGLQRERFLPAIALLKRDTEVIELDGGIDYRLRSLQQASLYHTPLGEEADKALSASFRRLVQEHATVHTGEIVEVLGRPISSRMSADDVIWFDFLELCDGPRSAYDYIELARIYQTVLLSNVPQLKADNDDMARRFVSLVDEFYDRNVKLIMAAEVPLLQLYAGGGLAFVFERTSSRLLEMQSHDYLAREHKA
ncbi:MAG: cell division protein ZapE [Pseudomonadota bacterium]